MRTYSIGTLLLACLLVVCGCQNPSGHSLNKETMAKDTPTPEPAPVEVEDVLSGPISDYLETTSNIYADSNVTIRPKIAGQVKKIMVEEGDHVKKGQILAIIDDDEYLLKKRQAEVVWNQAREKRDRLKEMFENRMVSQESYNDAVYACEDMEVMYKLAKLNVQHTRLKSPITGLVTEKSIRPGDLVSVSTSTINVVDPDSLMVDVFLPEREVIQLHENLTAEILPDSIPGRYFPAVIKRINPVIDPKTGTVKVTLVSAGNWTELSAGMFVRVRILLKHKENSVLLPKRSVIHRKDKTIVYVMTDDNLAEKRYVQLGLEDMNSYEVLSGIEVGEKLIVVGQHNLEQGQPVRLPGDRTPESSPLQQIDSDGSGK